MQLSQIYLIFADRKKLKVDDGERKTTDTR